MRNKRLASLSLLLALALQLWAPALAAGEGDTIYIGSADDLRSLAARCSYDAWSEGKTVVLQRDVSLGGVDFSPIASFGGVFEGNGHTVSGLNVASGVSPAGLFGTVAQGGVVRDLNVEGTVVPGGSAESAGGVAGINRGTLLGCSFVGTVKGEKRIGGVAGENAATGSIRRCTANGGVFGKNMTGGVVGANHGTVSLCVNRAYVNTDTLDPSVSFERLDLNLAEGAGSLASPDTYNVTVDSGGVAGFSDGTLIGCRNQGGVGYPHVGYNVGGVVGRSSGHAASCENEGKVFGRREVGGVAGMAEPYVKLDLKESSLEQVRQQLAALSGSVRRTIDDASGASAAVSARLTELNRGVNEAADRAQTLTDRLADSYDAAITEIDRGSDVADAAIEQLYGVSEALTEASGTLTGALGQLSGALKDFNGGGTAEELAQAADDLSRACGVLDRGTRQIRDNLSALRGAALKPAEGVTREQWRAGVYGADGVLAKLHGGAAQASAGLVAAAAVLGGAAALEKPKDAADGERYLRELAAYMDTADAAGKTNRDKLRESLAAVGDGLARMGEGARWLTENTSPDFAGMRAALDGIAAGFDTLAGGNGGKGAFALAGSGFDHLGRAVRDAKAPARELADAAAGLRDGAAELTEALDRAESLLDYLRRQDALHFEPLGTETDEAADALYDSMRGISGHLEQLNREARSASDTLLADVRQIERQFYALMDTLLDVVEDAEGASPTALVEDTSDEDVEAVVEGKLLLCANAGEVNGDIDVGGVAGAMLVYNELDPENDADAGGSALRRRYELKCVLQECVNRGVVTGKRDNVGAVCGNAALGVISGCEAYGAARSEGGDCVGGAAGFADNVVRGCWSHCTLSGARRIGGVVGGGRTEGSGLRIENCRSLVSVTESEEYAGAILGADAGSLSGNLFVSDALAGVDRVSERGRAEPATYAQLLEAGAPKEFRRFTLAFVADGETVRTKEFAYGDSFDASVFPEIPAKAGCYARWDRAELRDLRFDTTVTAVYEPCVAALESDILRSGSRPAFFAEGAYDADAALGASPAIFDFNDGESGFWSRLRSWRRTLLEQWELTIPDDGSPAHVIRYLPPEGVSDDLLLYALGERGWTRLEPGRMGSYLTFTAPAGTVDLTVVSTATPWWVWALVGLFLLAAAALAAALLIRKKPKAPAQELSEEEKKLLAKQKKRRRTLRAALAALALALGAGVGAAVLLAPGLADSMGLYMLLRNYAERTDLDMELSISADVRGRRFETDVDFFTTACGDHRVSCVLWQDIPLYYCDGVMLLENARAYRADGVLPDYAGLLPRAAGLYRAMDVTVDEENGVKTYHAAARGEAAQKLLAALLPQAAETAPETGEVVLDLMITDGEPTRLRFGWGGAFGSAQAELRPVDKARDHTLPQAVRAVIASGEYAEAEEVGPELRRLLLAWVELAARDPLDAEVALSADCGPLLLDEKLTWQRTREAGAELSCVSRRGTTVYYTDTAACTGSGMDLGAGSESFAGTAELLRLAYRAFLLGETTCAETAGGWRYTVALDGEGMTELAGTAVPETRALGVSFEEGEVRLELADDAVSSVEARCGGSVRVVGTDVPAEVRARLDFRREGGFPELSPRVRSVLGLEDQG